MSQEQEDVKVKEPSAGEPTPSLQLESAVETQPLTSRQLIEQSLEEMIAEMNAKRSRDQTLLQNFKKELDDWCNSAHAAVEAAVYQKTLKNSEVIDSKLRELVDALGRIRKLELEMEQFREQLGAFCVHVR